MADGASFARWHHTAAIQASIANSVRNEKKRKRPWYPRDFHVHLLRYGQKAAKAERVEVGVDVLKSVFVDNAPTDKIVAFYGLED